MKVIICDDDTHFAHWAENVVIEWANAQRILVQTEVFLSEEGFNRVYHNNVDLILMDVRLQDGSGGVIIEKKECAVMHSMTSSLCPHSARMKSISINC